MLHTFADHWACLSEFENSVSASDISSQTKYLVKACASAIPFPKIMDSWYYNEILLSNFAHTIFIVFSCYCDTGGVMQQPGSTAIDEIPCTAGGKINAFTY